MIANWCSRSLEVAEVHAMMMVYSGVTLERTVKVIVLTRRQMVESYADHGTFAVDTQGAATHELAAVVTP